VVDLPEIEQCLIASDEDLGSPADGAGKDWNIVGVLDQDGRIFPQFNHPAFGLQQTKESADDRLGQPELADEYSFELQQHRLARQQLMVVDDALEQFAAEAARGDTACENVRIEKDPHETSRNTSSSVR